jgi:hypothetical protein
VSAEFARRSVKMTVRVTPEEHALIHEKMALIGTTNQEAYLRRMAIDGLYVRLNLPELKEMVSLLRYTSNNINQMAKRLNETGRVYEADISDIQKRQTELFEKTNEIISKLAEL